MKVESLKLRVKSCLKKLVTCHWQRGFTLIEIVMVIIVVAIAVPALLILLGQGAKLGVDAELRVTATNVAQALMEEIRAKCWDETATTAPNCSGAVSPSAIGPDGEAREDFDDMDDYNFLNATPDIVTANGVNFTVSASVCYVDSADLNTCIGGMSNYKKIAITVTAPANWDSNVQLVTVVSNY